MWKETRQQLPLALMLVAVGALLMLFWGMLQDAGAPAQAYARSVPLVLPALFAAGAGALSVGQEKEQGTLWWLSAMPVTPRHLIWSKFLVALIGLATIWVYCWILLGIVQSSRGGRTSGLIPYLATPTWGD
ncbi:MAG: ABC transporter permease [Novipirellula sp. JB048]